MNETLQKDAELDRELREIKAWIAVARPIAETFSQGVTAAAIMGGISTLAAILGPLLWRALPW